MAKRTDQTHPLPPVLAHSCLGIVITHVLISAYSMEDPTSPIAIVTQAVFYLILAVILFGVQSRRLEFVTCVVLIGAATISRVLFAPDEQTVQAAADVALVAVGTLV
ncbi:MAG: hypothetical protein AAFR96_11265, partial [Planctomycetota bacterium]